MWYESRFSFLFGEKTKADKNPFTDFMMKTPLAQKTQSDSDSPTVVSYLLVGRGPHKIVRVINLVISSKSLYLRTVPRDCIGHQI
jgi:hypothetical protein